MCQKGEICSLRCSEIFSVPAKHNSSKELLQLDDTKPHCEVNTVYFCSVVEIFPPYKCTHGPGEDPFEAVMCAVGAASQISCCLWRILFLIQNITCNLCRIFKWKRFNLKRYTDVRFIIVILSYKHRSYTIRKCLTKNDLRDKFYESFPRMWLLTGGR